MIPFGHNIVIRFGFENIGDSLEQGQYVIPAPVGLAVNIDETLALMPDHLNLTVTADAAIFTGPVSTGVQWLTIVFVATDALLTDINREIINGGIAGETLNGPPANNIAYTGESTETIKQTTFGPTIAGTELILQVFDMEENLLLEIVGDNGQNITIQLDPTGLPVTDEPQLVMTSIFLPIINR